MATITIRNVPDALHDELKKQAATNHRSLNSEVNHRLQASLERRMDIESDLERARQVREKLKGVRVTDKWIQEAIDRRRS